MRYGEGVFVGYRGYDALDREVSYPFGHGLSYTSFEYADLEVRVSGRVQDDDLGVEISCRIANTGPRRGKEVVQLYVGDLQASVARPPRELRAFAKVDLDAGQGETLTFHLEARDFSFWSSTHRDWVLEPGEFTLAIGASSRDLRLMAALDLAAPLRPVPLDATASLEEWLADPAGAPVLREVVGTDETGRPPGILGDHELRAVVGNFPIGALTAFPGSGLDEGTVDALLRRLRDPASSLAGRT